MPKHAEMSGSEKVPSRPEVVDSKKEAPPKAANDNEKGPHLVHDNPEYLPDVGPARDIVEMAKQAEPGDMLFMHDIVGKSGADNSSHLAVSGHEGSRYIKGVKKAFENSEKVVVLDWPALQAKMNENSQGSKEALKSIAAEHQDKIILLDFNPLEDKSIAPSWSKLEHVMGDHAKLKGEEAETWLRSWIKREESNNHKDGEPTLDEMREGCAQALGGLSNLSVNLGKTLRQGESGSPLALALVIFAARKGLDSTRVNALLNKPHHVREAVTFIEVSGNKIRTYFGDEVFEQTF